jgi:hypothetical protein
VVSVAGISTPLRRLHHMFILSYKEVKRKMQQIAFNTA